MSIAFIEVLNAGHTYLDMLEREQKNSGGGNSHVEHFGT
ncbi:hypothetical protein J2X61_003686 [Bacillus sp. 3255]|nr:hypothetical protein [Bacillus sp. 3255]